MQAPTGISLGGPQWGSVGKQEVKGITSGEQAPPNSPADQKAKNLSTGLYRSSATSISSTESHDTIIEYGQRQKELRAEVIAEAGSQGRKLSEAEIEEIIGRKIDAARWICITMQKRY